jgi:hypothetical protein
MALLLAVARPGAAEEPALRHSAPITVVQAAPFVQLALPASAYARSQGDALQDLRVVDARGERVPFALLAPRASESQDLLQQRPATLYPLPRKPAAGQPWASPVEVVVQGERISVRRLGGGKTAGAALAAVPGSAGWLIDMGERGRDEPAPRSLLIAWSGPAEFSAAYDIETSEDLRSWRVGGSGQLMALTSATGPLTQPSVVLPAAAGRFVRLVWRDPATAPAVTSAMRVTAQQRSVVLDAPTQWPVASSPEPVGKAASDTLAARALHFDLGGAVPLVQIELQWDTGTRVAPVRVQGRNSADEPWRDVVQGVFYRLERGDTVSQSPPLALNTRLRYVRFVPDERAAALPAEQTKLVVQAQLARLVFATQGQAPYALQAGAAQAKAGALPVGTLVPALDEERARFGQATLGEWAEVPEAARQAAAKERMARLRPWLLWAVLVAGVAGLGFMVWRLARAKPAA